MTDVRIQGSATTARVKPLDSTLAPHAKLLLEARRDGYDTYGVSADGGDKLILTQSKKPLTVSDAVTIDGKPAKVKFVENEANTFGERFRAPFKSTGGRVAMGVGSAIAMGIAAPVGIALSVTGIPFVLGLAAWGVFGAGVIAGVMAIGSAVKAGTNGGAKPDESVTDTFANK